MTPLIPAVPAYPVEQKKYTHVPSTVINCFFVCLFLFRSYSRFFSFVLHLYHTSVLLSFITDVSSNEYLLKHYSVIYRYSPTYLTAVVLCIIFGISCLLEIYLGQLLWLWLSLAPIGACRSKCSWLDCHVQRLCLVGWLWSRTSRWWKRSLLGTNLPPHWEGGHMPGIWGVWQCLLRACRTFERRHAFLSRSWPRYRGVYFSVFFLLDTCLSLTSQTSVVPLTTTSGRTEQASPGSLVRDRGAGIRAPWSQSNVPSSTCGNNRP